MDNTIHHNTNQVIFFPMKSGKFFIYFSLIHSARLCIILLEKIESKMEMLLLQCYLLHLQFSIHLTIHVSKPQSLVRLMYKNQSTPWTHAWLVLVPSSPQLPHLIVLLGCFIVNSSASASFLFPVDRHGCSRSGLSSRRFPINLLQRISIQPIRSC